MTAGERHFRITCRLCRRLLLVVARIGGAELDRLREHIRQGHPCETLPTDAGAADVLRHFDV